VPITINNTRNYSCFYSAAYIMRNKDKIIYCYIIGTIIENSTYIFDGIWLHAASIIGSCRRWSFTADCV